MHCVRSWNLGSQTSPDRWRFPFSRPALPEPEAWLGHLDGSYRARRFSNTGPLVERLEAGLSARVPGGRRAATSAPSATAGLVATLLGLGVRGPVAIPAFTFPATAHAVELAGCEPVLCDADPETWELSPEAAAAAIAEHGCVAIVHVRSFGLCRELGTLSQIAADAHVPLVIDGAAAFGGEMAAGDPVGGAGDAEVFSFHATKVFAIGEGGAVLTTGELALEIRRVANFALDGLDVTGRGLNGKLSELAAAVGLAMLERLDDHIANRRRAIDDLAAAVRASEAPAQLPADPGRPPWQTLPLLFAHESLRNHALERLGRGGIEARPYYAPGLHRTRAFAGCQHGPLPETESLAERTLCLPVYSDLTDGERDELSSLVCDALTDARREA